MRTAFFIYEGDTLLNINPDDYYGIAPDMGGYEFYQCGAELGDVNGEGNINILDLVQIASW